MRRVFGIPIEPLVTITCIALAVIVGLQVGGVRIPRLPSLSLLQLVVVSVAFCASGTVAVLLREPDKIGEIAPLVYAFVGFPPLLRFVVPGADLVRFIPLALVAPVVYGLYRAGSFTTGQAFAARVTGFAVLSSVATSLIANPLTTDMARLILMASGIVVLAVAAPRAWGFLWSEAVARAAHASFLAIVVSTPFTLLVDGSILNGRYRGLFFSPNTVGALLAITTPIAASRTRFAGVYWVASIGIVVASGSRGGMLAVSAGLLYELWRGRRVGIAIVVSLLAIVVLSAGVVRVQSDHEENFGVNTRELIWAEVGERAMERPLIGHGFGSMRDFEYSAETRRWSGQKPETHSSWVDALYEQGVLGLVLFGAVFVVGLRRSVDAGTAWTAALLAGLVSATFESWMFSLAGGIGSLYWLILGAAIGADRFAEFRLALEAESFA